MKVIQSFWAQRDIPAYYREKHTAAVWPSLKYELLSRTYSCLQAAKYHPTVSLYTDSYGKSILIDALKLPYTEVYTSMDDIQPVHPELWIEGFLHTIGQQTEPFVYVHDDVYFKMALPEDIINREAFIFMTGLWHEAMTREQIEQSFCYTDSYVYRSMGVHHRNLQPEFGLGFVGFGRLDWIPDYLGWSHTMLSQWLSDKSFTYMKSYNIPFVNAMLKRVLADNQIPLRVCDYIFRHEEHYQDLFSYRPENAVLHIPHHLKNDRTVCLELEMLVKSQYPDYYERVLSYIEKQDQANPMMVQGNVAYELPSLFRFSQHKAQAASLFNYFPRTLLLLQIEKPGDLSQFFQVNIADTVEELIVSFEDFAGSHAKHIRCLSDAWRYEHEKYGCGIRKRNASAIMAQSDHLLYEWSDEALLAQTFSLSPQATIHTAQYDWTLCGLRQDSCEVNIGMLLEMQNKPSKNTYILFYPDPISGTITERCLHGHDALLLGFETSASLSSVFEEMRELSNISCSAESDNFFIRFMDAARFFIRYGVLTRSEE